MSRARDLADSADKDIAGTLTVDAITASGTIAANSYTGDGSSLTGINTDLVADTTPELGGVLSTNGNDINFGDNDKAVFGASSDLQIYHDGSNSYVRDAGTGSLYIQGSAQTILGSSNGENGVVVNENGDTVLKYDNSNKLITKTDGVDITGELQADSLDIDGVADFTGKTTHRGGISLLDNDVLTLGTSDDLQIYHSGADSFIKDTGTGDLNIMAADNLRLMDINSENWLYAAQNGEVRLYYDAAEKFRTTSGGVQVTGSVITDRLVIEDDGSSSPLLQLMADDQSPWALRIGNSTYSTGNHGILSYVGNTGGGIIQSQGNGAYQTLTFNQSDDSLVRAMMQMNATGSVRLFYQGNEKLYTKSDGVDITGEVQADSLDIDGAADFSGGNVRFNGTYDAVWDYTNSKMVFEDNAKATFGSNSDLNIYHDGSNSYISDGGTGDLIVKGTQLKLQDANGADYLRGFTAGAVYLHYNGSSKFETLSNGAQVTGTFYADGVVVGDSEKIQLGNSQDFQLYHDGSNSYIDDAGTGEMVIRGNGGVQIHKYTGELLANFRADGNAALYYDGAQKFTTTSSGVSVTGSVSMTDVLLLDQNASNHSSTTEGAMYYNTGDDAARIYAGGKWNNISTTPAVTPAALNFMNHNYSRSSYTGQDGYTRTYGKLTSPTQTYAGNTFATAFDGASNHVLVLRFLASSAAYVGIGVSIASSITDAQADNNPGSGYYGLGGDWTGASGVTHYGGYFNNSSTVPTHTTTDGYLYFYTEGSGASRTLQMKFSAIYSNDFLNTGTELQAGNDTPSGGTKISQSILPITIGTNDFALAIGEASDTYEWRIERYGTY